MKSQATDGGVDEAGVILLQVLYPHTTIDIRYTDNLSIYWRPSTRGCVC